MDAVPLDESHGKRATSWWSTNPATGPVGTANTWVGIHFGLTAPGRMAGCRQYVDNAVDGNWYGVLFDIVGLKVLRSWAWRPRASTVGAHWHQQWFRPWCRLDPAGDYWLAVTFPGGHYYRTNSIVLAGAGLTHNNIHYSDSWQSTVMFPFGTAVTYNTNANAIDPLIYFD